MKKHVEFDNGRGQKLAGVLHLPPGKKLPAIVLCHGFLGSKDGDKYVALAEAFCRAGFAALRFDLTYSGESGGWADFAKTTVSGEIRDLKAALDFVAAVPEIDAKRIGVFGHSLGGEVAIIGAARDPRIRCLVASAPVIDFAEVFSRSWEKPEAWKAKGSIQVEEDSGLKVEVSYALYEDGLKYSPLEEEAAVKCPFLIIHGDKDTDVPLITSHALYKGANEPKKLIIVKGANHNYDELGQLDEVIAASLGWFKQYL